MLGQVSGNFDGNNSNGSGDYFLMKYNSSGTKQWSKLFGSDQTDDGVRIAFDSNNDIYVTGSTRGDLGGNTNSGGSSDSGGGTSDSSEGDGESGASNENKDVDAI